MKTHTKAAGTHALDLRAATPTKRHKQHKTYTIVSPMSPNSAALMNGQGYPTSCLRNELENIVH